MFESTNDGVDDSQSTMYIYTDDMDELTIYIRSNGESDYDYAVAHNADSYPDQWYDDVYASTQGLATSDQSLTAYTPVTYSLGSGNYTILVRYGKDGSVSEGDDRGYVLIPKGTFTWVTYDTREMVDAGGGAALAVEGKSKVITLEQYT